MTDDCYPAMRVTPDNLDTVAQWANGTVTENRGVAVTGSMWGLCTVVAHCGQWVIRREDGCYFVRTDQQIARENVQLQPIQNP